MNGAPEVERAFEKLSSKPTSEPASELASEPTKEGATQEPVHGTVNESSLESTDGNGGHVEQTALVDWDSPDDPGNPQNWSLGKKIIHTAVPGLFGFSV